MSNQSNELRKIAIEKHADSILYIKEPTKSEIDLAIEKDPFIILKMNNVTKDMKIKAVKLNGMALEAFDAKEMTNEIIDIALKNNGLAIKFIEKPTLNQRGQALLQNVLAIEFIKNANSTEESIAIKSNGASIKFIKNPNYTTKLEAVKSNGLALRYIDTEDDKIITAALKQNGLA